MRILVLGGTGFIGPHVVRRLLTSGHELALFHRGQTEAELPEAIRHIHGDRGRLGDHRADFERFAPELVLDMRPLTESEALGAVQTFRGIARRLVAISSGDVYRAYGILHRKEPGLPDPVPISEDAPLRQTLYPYRLASPRAPDDPMRWVDDYDKVLVERAAMGEPSLPGTVLRLPMVYGPGDPHHRLFPEVKRMDDGRPAILLAEDRARWCWTRGYVEDVAEAIVLATLDDRAAGRVYNVGEPDALSETEWIQAIGRAAGWTGAVVAVPKDRLPERMKASPFAGLNFDQHLATDTTRIREELGYAETVSRAEALRRTIAWERAHPPQSIDPLDFDYDAEDIALRSSRGIETEGIS